MKEGHITVAPDTEATADPFATPLEIQALVDGPPRIPEISAVAEQTHLSLLPQKVLDMICRILSPQDLPNFLEAAGMQLVTKWTRLETLPEEVLDLVCQMLPTEDLLNCWKAIGVDPDSVRPAFWKSRFAPGLDFGFVYEFDEIWNNEDVDWGAVQLEVGRHLSPGATDGRGMRNRQRILGVLEQIVGLIFLPIAKESEGIYEAPRRSDLLCPVPDPGTCTPMLRTDGFQLHW